MTDENSPALPPAPSTTFVSVPMIELVADQALPGSLYLCLHHKMVRYRTKGAKLDTQQFNKLVYAQVKYVFVEEEERAAFEDWIGARNKEESAPADLNAVAGAPPPAEVGELKTEAPKIEVKPEDAKPIIEAIGEQRRAVMDIFQSPKDEKQVVQAVETSKKMVSEFLRKPYAVNNVMLLQKYSKGVFDHSLNVSILSSFLGLRMGYSHQLILENLAMGGLFHDIGKTLVQSKGEFIEGEEDPELQKHPLLGAELIGRNPQIPNEVKMIIAQHHEMLDGSGYPKRLKGLAVYDLARLVAIANIYDNLITQSFAPTLKERAVEALEHLENDYQGRLDPKKLEKAVKILRYSFL